MTVNKETYKVERENYYTTKYKKEQIILASSMRKENFHLKRLKNKEGGKTKTWNTYTISRDGTIFQHYNPKYYTDFMGNKVIDKKSISIVLENMNNLYYYDGSYVNALNEECDEKNVVEKKWKDFTYWESYTEQQMNSLVYLCRVLVNEFNMVNDSYGHSSYEENTKLFKGIVCRSNYSFDYYDLNVTFNWKRFLNDMNITFN